MGAVEWLGELALSADTKDQDPFELVIMDLTIPGGIGGKEAIKDILTIDPEAKVIGADTLVYIDQTPLGKPKTEGCFFEF